MTRNIILRLITIVNILILDIAVIVRTVVSSYKKNPPTQGLHPLHTTHSIPLTLPPPTPFSPSLPFLFFLWLFRHQVVLLYLVHVLLLSFFFYRISNTCTNFFIFPRIKSSFTNCYSCSIHNCPCSYYVFICKRLVVLLAHTMQSLMVAQHSIVVIYIVPSFWCMPSLSTYK